ncbi:MAG: hypothetical protein AAF645_29645, partial [Myxococcota bacterium]
LAVPAALHHVPHGRTSWTRRVMRTLLTLVGASAMYGFSIGAVHSVRFALRNLIKFPLLLLVTACVCWVAYVLAARALCPDLRSSAVLVSVLRIFADTSRLLAGLAPVMLFLAVVLERADDGGLNDYPVFLALNVLIIAGCGALALLRRTRAIAARHRLSASRAGAITTTWMLLSLLVGSQWSWYLRPFCGVATVDAPFMLGAEPDFRGATNFYQAVYQVFDPPPSPARSP